MKKIVKLNERNLTRLVRRVINEIEDDKAKSYRCEKYSKAMDAYFDEIKEIKNRKGDKIPLSEFSNYLKYRLESVIKTARQENCQNIKELESKYNRYLGDFKYEDYDIKSDEKIIKVVSPIENSSTKYEVYEDFEYAYNKVDDLYKKLKSKEIGHLRESDRIFNILYNTAHHQVDLARERHKTDKPLTDTQKSLSDIKFNWDERKVAYDEGNIKAQDMFHKLHFLLTGEERQRIDPEELLNLQDSLTSQIQDYQKDREQELDYIQNKEKGEKDYTKSDIQSMIDNAIDNKNYEELNKIRTNPNFAWFFNMSENKNFNLNEELLSIKTLMNKLRVL